MRLATGKRRWRWVVALAAGVLLWRAGAPRAPAEHRCRQADRPARLRPDYTGLAIPPNIAPLNCAVLEPGRRWRVRLTGGGRTLTVGARHGLVDLPLGAWQPLLAASRGQAVRLDVYVQGTDGAWTHFRPTTCRVAPEPIDGYVVYRRFRPAYNVYVYGMGLWQRDLASFRVRRLVDRAQIGGQCHNCHTFADRRPDRFLFHTRPTNGGQPAMVLVTDGRARALDTRTPQHDRPAAYASWHPNGDLLCFSFNQIKPFFWHAGPQTKDTVDIASGLAVYNVRDGSSTVPAPLNQPDLNTTFPCWAADGRALYFSRVRRTWPANDDLPMRQVRATRYDLCRAAFDPASGAWGPVEIVAAAEDLGHSLLEPRVSPDGRWLAFCAAGHGAFPPFLDHADVWLLDLRAAHPRPFQVEPATASLRDSWPSWSSNSRWLVFSRRSDTDRSARTWLRYVGADGTLGKAFVVPERDPTLNDRLLETYNRPELVTGPVRLPPGELRAVAAKVGPPAAGATGGTPAAAEPPS